MFCTDACSIKRGSKIISAGQNRERGQTRHQWQDLLLAMIKKRNIVTSMASTISQPLLTTATLVDLSTFLERKRNRSRLEAKNVVIARRKKLTISVDVEHGEGLLQVGDFLFR